MNQANKTKKVKQALQPFNIEMQHIHTTAVGVNYTIRENMKGLTNSSIGDQSILHQALFNPSDGYLCSKIQADGVHAVSPIILFSWLHYRFS